MGTRTSLSSRSGASVVCGHLGVTDWADECMKLERPGGDEGFYTNVLGFGGGWTLGGVTPGVRRVYPCGYAPCMRRTACCVVLSLSFIGSVVEWVSACL